MLVTCAPDDPEVAQRFLIAGLADPHRVEVVTDRDELLDQAVLFLELGHHEAIVARGPDPDLLVGALHREHLAAVQEGVRVRE